MAGRKSGIQTLGTVLILLLRETGVTQTDFAARCHMSQRMLGRYVNGKASPPPARALAMLHAARFAPLHHYTAFGDALGIPVAERLPPHSPSRMAAGAVPLGGEAEMALTLFFAAEANGVSSKGARAVVLAALEHANARGLSVPQAKALVEATVRRSGG